MKRHELVTLQAALEEIKKIPGTVKWAYAMAKNLNLIKQETANYVSLAQLQQEYDKQREGICKKFCKKDEKGAPILKDIEENGDKKKAYDLPDETKAEFETLLKGTQDGINKKFQELKKFMEEEAGEIKLHKIKLDELPDGITPEQVGNIFHVVIEE